MRALTLIPLLVLAACSGENQGWNPNYRAAATPYGDYLRTRELALTGYRPEPPRVIPVALPARAPTPAEIAGRSPVQILEQAVTPNGLPPRQVPLRGAPAVDPIPPTGDAAHGIRPKLVTTAPVLDKRVVVRPAPVAQVTPRVATPPQVTTRALPARIEPIYPRAVRAIGNCAAYPTGIAAQRAFTSEGGPRVDRLGLDPDGDGYACSFRPAAVSPVR